MTLLCKLHDFVAAFSDFLFLPLVHPELFKRIQQGSEDFVIIAYKLVPHNGEGPLNLILPNCLPAAFGFVQNVLTAAPLGFLIGLADVDFLPPQDTPAFAAEDFTAEGIPALVFTRIVHPHLLSAVFKDFPDRLRLLM